MLLSDLCDTFAIFAWNMIQMASVEWRVANNTLEFISLRLSAPAVSLYHKVHEVQHKEHK